MSRIGITLAVIIVCGCASTPTTTPASEQKSTTQTTVAQPSDAVLADCNYSYWHVAPGASWKYHVATRGSSYPHPSSVPEFNRTERIDAVTPGEFRLAFTNSDSSEEPWVKIFRCGVSGPAQIANEIEQANGMRPSGRFLPAKLEPGSEWENVYEAGGHVSRTRFRAVGRETMTVPAGTYDAMRVDYVRTDTTGPDVTMKVEGSLWFAPAVGVVNERFRLVASVGDTTEAGETVQELIEFRP